VQHELGRPAPAEPSAARGTRERERLVRDAVHVAEDQVGGVARLDQGVGAAVDAQQHRADVADVRAKDRQVLLVVVAANHDQDRVGS
jgi:hypothetical protein